MTRDDAVARIKQGLGFRTDLDAEAALMINEAQRFFEKGKTLPWFLLEETATVTLDASVDPNLVSLPAGFIREAEGRHVYFTNADNEKIILKKKDFKSAFEAYKDEEAGDPEVYALLSAQLYFLPAAAPGDTYTITFPYYKAAAVMTAGTDENLWLANVPELLIGEAGYRLAYDLRDQGAMKLFDSMRKEAWDSVFRETVAREEAARDISVGSDL